MRVRFRAVPPSAFWRLVFFALLLLLPGLGVALSGL